MKHNSFAIGTPAPCLTRSCSRSAISCTPPFPSATTRYALAGEADSHLTLLKDNNVVVRTWGEKRAHADNMHHHHELLYMIDGYEPKPGAFRPRASSAPYCAHQELRSLATAATS